MLCFEGIALNLKVFLRQMELPDFFLKSPSQKGLHLITVDPEVIFTTSTCPGKDTAH